MNIRVCVFGDSIAWGACDYEKGGWAERLKSYYLKNTDEVEIYNLSVSDEKTESLLKRFEAEAKTRRPDRIIFAVGLNDSRYAQNEENPDVSPEKFERNLFELTAAARRFTDKVVFLGLTGVDESKTKQTPWHERIYFSNANIEKYDAMIKNFCEKEKLEYVGIKAAVEIDDLEDGLHPNSRGHEKIFKTVLNALDEFLRG